MSGEIFIIGYGSQGRAWAQNLRDSGWRVHVYLGSRQGSYVQAKEDGFAPSLLINLPGDLPTNRPATVAFLIPDDRIGLIYREFIARHESPLRVVLAHGFAVYAGDLEAAHDNHQLILFAPKAIGPKLRQSFSNGSPHRLKAAVNAPSVVGDLATGLGFRCEGLIEASFEQETVGDLISEQGLLCGGVFTLMEQTVKQMKQAGVPEELIKEECYTELELIAGMVREQGPAGTFKKISRAAQVGTLAMRARLLKAGISQSLADQAAEVVSKDFVKKVKAYPAGENEAFMDEMKGWPQP